MRKFSEVEKDLRDTLLKLQGTKDPELRFVLLRDMKILLLEADGILLSMQPLAVFPETPAE